jgi:aryl-alcohol dehydrogenase-like predicted oxidoreductase
MNQASRTLGSSRVAVGPLGLGCWPLAGMTRAGMTREAAIATVGAAIDAGIAHLDTAYCYGEHGESEQAIRAALAERGGAAARDKVVIAGKCGIHWEHDPTLSPPRRQVVDGRPQRIRAEVEESLTRLGTDRLDLLYLHAPDPNVPLEESAGELRRLADEGKALAIGLSNGGRASLERFASACPLAACQLPFNMLQREIEAEILPWCRAHGVGLVAYWPLMKGLLTGKMRPGQTFPPDDSRRKYAIFQGEQFARNLDFVESLRPIAARLGAPLPDLVLAWTAEQSGVVSVLFGATSPEQVVENARAITCGLDDEARRDIAAAIEARGPVPGRQPV